MEFLFLRFLSGNIISKSLPCIFHVGVHVHIHRWWSEDSQFAHSSSYPHLTVGLSQTTRGWHAWEMVNWALCQTRLSYLHFWFVSSGIIVYNLLTERHGTCCYISSWKTVEGVVCYITQDSIYEFPAGSWRTGSRSSQCVEMGKSALRNTWGWGVSLQLLRNRRWCQVELRSWRKADTGEKSGNATSHRWKYKDWALKLMQGWSDDKCMGL